MPLSKSVQLRPVGPAGSLQPCAETLACDDEELVGVRDKIIEQAES